MNVLFITFTVLASLPAQVQFQHDTCEADWLNGSQMQEVLQVELSEMPLHPEANVRVELSHCSATSAQISINQNNNKDHCAMDVPIVFFTDTPDKQRTLALQITEMIEFCQHQLSPPTPEAKSSPSSALPSLSVPLVSNAKHPSGDVNKKVHTFPERKTFALKTRRGGWFCKCGLMELNDTAPADETITKFSPEDLFALADGARIDGNPEGAIIPLQTFLNQYPNHPKAAVAAFTIAKLYMDALFIPTRAAEYFEKSIELGLAEPLRETALARTAEAYHRARNPRYGSAVSAYLQRYPHGQFQQMLHHLSLRR